MSHALPASSGGFPYRSDRDTLKQVSPTQPALGPGSYELNRPLDVITPAPAPFHTSTERVYAANATTSAVTPGPGAYDGAARAAADGGVGGNATGALVGPSSAFTSGVPRLPTDGDNKARRTVPGPGAYDDGNQWVKGGHRYRPDGLGANAAAARVAQLLPRRPVAPSVPGRGESYGYEEGADGSLVLQAAPEPSHTGEGRDKVGPGTYELAGQGPFTRPSGTKWSNSKSGRCLKFGSPAPGPGTYNLADGGPRRQGAGLLVQIGGVEVVFGGTAGTSSFVSKAARPLQQYAAASPGPGEYLALKGAGAGPGMPTTAVFGSTAARGSWEVDPTKARAAPTYFKAPGPGAYEAPRSRGSAPGAGAPQGSSGGAMLAAAASSAAPPFASTALRFHGGPEAAPGPGDYHTDAVTSLEYDTFKKVTGSRPSGAFGASTGRFAYQRNASSPAGTAVPGVIDSGWAGGANGSPGPGNYDPKLGGTGRSVGRAGNSTFASRTGRFRPVTAPPAVPDLAEYDGNNPPRGDPARLGPGSYSPEKPLGRPRYSQAAAKVAPFGTESNRARVELVTQANPGPGCYDSLSAIDPRAAKPVTLPPSKNGFLAQTDRFVNPMLGGASKFTPGPGAYLGPSSKNVVKGSFNITYNNTSFV